MCGIFGYTGFQKKNLEKARDSLHTLTHRGPDQWNDYFDDEVYIGHQRLSILDLSDHGKQPMTNDDESVIISVNGEIYNFKKLKQELSTKYTFKSESDSEVILYGYIEWGIKALLEKIDGMYAFTVYDKNKDLLYLCRDRVGIKPLYYGYLNNQLSWASELKALQKFYENQDLHLDYTALYDYLTYLYIPTPKTMYQNIYKLPPGNFLEFDLRKNVFNIKQYWKLEIKASTDDVDKAKKTIRQLVSQSVEEQMVADVQVGFFLSGGLDSSIIVAAASKNHSHINTYSIGFSVKSHDETHFADLVAQKYDTNHLKKILEEETTKEYIGKIKEWYDEPFADTSCFPTFLVSKLAKENSTVVLTGDGGDEIFGGYNWYKQFIKIQKNNIKFLKFLKKYIRKIGSGKSLLHKIMRKFENSYLLDDLEIYTHLMGGMLQHEKSAYRKAWNIPDNYDDYWYFRKYYKKELPIYTRLQYLDFHTYLHDDILTKVDRVSMAVSLECRVPLLSKEIIEYSFSLKDEVRLCNNELKGVLKHAFDDALPLEILNRGKKGFSIPISYWDKIFGRKLKKSEAILQEIYHIGR